MAPSLKILMTSGSKKGTQIYYFFSRKSPSKWTPSRFPSRAPMERDTRLQGILRISKWPNKNSSNKKAPRKKRPFMFPKSGAPMERDARLQSLFYISFRVPCKGTPLQVPFTELPQRETLHLQSPFQPYLKVPGRWAHSRFPNWARIKRDAHPQSLPFITFRTPSKGAPHQFPLTELP